jgi:transposase
MEALRLPIRKTSTWLTLPSLALTAFTRLDELGLVVVGQRLEPGRAVLACRVLEDLDDPEGADRWCRRCGSEGVVRDSVVRRLAHELFGWRPTTLLVTIRRYRCTAPGCGRVWRQDTSKTAAPRAKLSRGGIRWALEGLVVQHLSVARVAEGLGVSWNTANDAVLAEGRRVLIGDPTRLAGVAVIGVDEHVWRHTRADDKYVTVIIDLTPVRAGTGPSRLLDMVEGRSKQAFKQWLSEQEQAWRDRVEVVAMDGFPPLRESQREVPPPGSGPPLQRSCRRRSR